ncbi:hypothetical protein DINM_004118 [Dirofilaria immitis]|nr:hypothetical protein [Dirofilaria immitis]
MWSVLGSIVVSIRACHVRDPGSIPGRGENEETWEVYWQSYFSSNSTKRQLTLSWNLLSSSGIELRWILFAMLRELSVKLIFKEFLQRLSFLLRSYVFFTMMTDDLEMS